MKNWAIFTLVFACSLFGCQSQEEKAIDTWNKRIEEYHNERDTLRK